MHVNSILRPLIICHVLLNLFQQLIKSTCSETMKQVQGDQKIILQSELYCNQVSISQNSFISGPVYGIVKPYRGRVCVEG